MKKTTEIDFARNPDKVDIGDWVFHNGKIGKIIDYAIKKDNFLQFRILFDGETIAESVMADNLKKVIQPEDNFVDTIFLDLITIDSNLQQRIKLDNSVINDYQFAYSEGIKLPPITIWNCIDDGLLYLVDGFHRYYSAKKAGLLELPCNKLSGSYREAVLYSVGVNSTHGLKRSNEDKRKAVLTLLQDEEWSQWSNRAIALQCGVSYQFVNNLRHTFSSNRILTDNVVSSTSDNDSDISINSEENNGNLTDNNRSSTSEENKGSLTDNVVSSTTNEDKRKYKKGGIEYEMNITNLSEKPQKKEIILKEGLNYYARTKGGNRWYVQVSEDTYQGLKIYQQQIRAIDIEKIFRDFLIDKGILKVHPDDCTILYLGGNNG